MDCIHHSGQQCTHIFIANGYQGKLFCNSCSYEYRSIPHDIKNESSDDKNQRKTVFQEIPPKLVISNIAYINWAIIPFKEFLDRLSQLKRWDIKKNYIDEMKQCIKGIQEKLENVFKTIKQILDEFEKQNEDLYNRIIIKDQGEFTFSSIPTTKLKFLANVLENNLLQQWVDWGDNCLKDIQKKLDILKKGINDLIDQTMKVKVEVKDSKLIEVKEAFGMKYGEQNYIINGSIELAGKYQFNKPKGLWHEFVKQKSLKKQNFQIIYEEGLMIYMKDGVILKIIPQNQEPYIIQNIEQLKYLEIKGFFQQSDLYWQGECLKSGGQYDNNGKKTGAWKELSDNYQNNAKVMYHQHYEKGILNGYQKIIFNEIIIGGGEFKQGVKDGKWMEIDDKFCRKLQIIEKGEYKNGVRFQTWDISLNNEIIGGGNYNENGNKIGQWIELHECFNIDNRVFYVGNYNKGNRDGQWEIKDQSGKIGGGMYIDGRKTGEWTQISENFLKPQILKISYEVYSKGNYENGKKQGEWNFEFDKKIVGQGVYNKGLKNGFWIELSQNFNTNQQIYLKGNYENGFKTGNWEIFRGEQKIGGGNYNNGRKDGDWIEIDEQFDTQSIIVFKGKYLNGLKLGNWRIEYDLMRQQEIGGGSYSDEQKKDGMWKEIYDCFSDSSLLFEGQYQKGFRVFKWEIKKDNKKIGGGEFDNLGRKNGFWEELHENYNLYCFYRKVFRNCQVIYKGNYCFGRKCGKWSTQYLKEDGQFCEIGDGCYDENGMKQGNWTELYHHFSDFSQMKMSGSYSDGIKQGTWNIFNKLQKVGEGKYENGLKYGQWQEQQEDQNKIQGQQY